jgi:hypothetical protein
MDDNIHFSRVIEENLDRGFQVRLVVNEFREVLYLQLRKYFLSYEGDWIPSREGVSIPASLENIYHLLDGLLEICAEAEGIEVIEKYHQLVSKK